MPHALSKKQKQYLEFIRNYIKDNECSPRLEEIAKNFGITSPTAHRMLEVLQSKGFLYFARDSISGFYIRLIERAGSTETVMEVPMTGRVNEIGELYDFPKKIGHFASVFSGAAPQSVFALSVSFDLPQANMIVGDLIIFDLDKKPQAGDICIGPIGERLFLIKIAGRTIDKRFHSIETAIWYPIPEDLTDPEMGQLFNWYPLAYEEDTHDRYISIAESQDFPIGPLHPDFIVATALRLSRILTF